MVKMQTQTILSVDIELADLYNSPLTGNIAILVSYPDRDVNMLLNIEYDHYFVIVSISILVKIISCASIVFLTS